MAEAKSQATSGFGTVLKRGDGATPTEAFTAIAELFDIDPPGLDSTRIEVTHHESPSAHKEFIMGLQEVEEFTIDISFLPNHATHNETAGLVADWKNKTKRNYQLVQGPKTWTFEAFVANFKPSAPKDDRRSANVTFRPTGVATIAATV